MEEMTYYKLIDGQKFIGVATSDNFLRFQNKHQIMLLCDISEVQYIICGENIYHAKWMCPENSDKHGKYKTVDVLEITESEYNELHEVEEYDIPEPEDSEDVVEIETDLIAQCTLDYVISQKIKAMKYACNNAITNGFEVTFNDTTLHFSLTTQDQLNLISLASMAASGATDIPYHADNMPCQFFTAEQISAICAAAQETITRETTYFNSLKLYINSLTNAFDVTAVNYGSDVPAEFQSEVYKKLFAAKESN